MSATGVLVAVLIGVLTGWAADLAFDRRRGLFGKLLTGVVGAFAGAFVARRLNFGDGGLVGDGVVCLLGALLFLAALAVFRRVR
jgi:uncharacterized membrane protein YeaQ/YmgE (transglycosylase-associated protein family)